MCLLEFGPKNSSKIIISCFIFNKRVDLKNIGLQMEERRKFGLQVKEIKKSSLKLRKEGNLGLREGRESQWAAKE